MALLPHDLFYHIKYVHFLHAEYARRPKNIFRRWDEQTPFLIHPLWCMSTIAAETCLSADVRFRGMLVLLYHDVLEDTDGTLPENLPSDVIAGVRDMTFETLQQEMRDLWDKPAEIRLFKLYDKVSNLMDWYNSNPELTAQYRDFTRRIAQDVEAHYGQLNIVRLARSLLANPHP